MNCYKNIRSQIRVVIGLSILVMILLFQNHVLAEQNYRFLAIEGQPVPWLNDGSRWNGLNPSSINDSGQIAVRASLKIGSGSTAEVSQVISMLDLQGNGYLVAREGEIAPNATTNTDYDNLMSRPNINNHGVISFWSRLSNPIGPTDTSKDSAKFFNANGGTELIIQEGDLIAGTSPLTTIEDMFSYNDSPAINDLDELTFEGVTSPQGRPGVFAWHNDSLETIALSGSLVPGLIDGTTYKSAANSSINSNGTVVFEAGLNPGSSSTPEMAIVSASTTGHEIIIGVGDHPPGFDQGSELRNFRGPYLSDSGLYGFSGKVETGSDEITAIFVGEKNNLQRIAKEGDSISGSSYLLGSGPQDRPYLRMNESGDVVFNSSIIESGSGASYSGIIAVLDNELELIAREGASIPGLLDGEFFGAIDTTPTASGIINDSGDIVFIAPIDGPNVTNQNDSGLFHYNGDSGTLNMLAREGDFFDLDPDPNVESLARVSPSGIRQINFSTYSASPAFNNDGLLVASVSFGNNPLSTLMLFDTRGVLVPEPSSLIMLAFLPGTFFLQRSARIYHVFD